MPIKFYCKHCGQRLSVASKKAGKKVACPACKGRITIPVESEARRSEKPTEPSETPRQKSSSSTKKQKPAKAAPPTEAMLDADQNQFLEDLDDIGPLGESWDELLDGDWDAAASAETEEPAIEEQEPTPEPAPRPEKQAPKAKSSPPPKPAIEAAPEPEPEPAPPVKPVAETEVTAETSPAPETFEDDDLMAASEWLEEIESPEADEDLATEPVSEQPAEPEQDDVAELEEVASTEPAPETEAAPEPVVASAPSPRFIVEEEEDDDDDDDDEGFSIRSAESEFEEMDLTPMVDVTFLLLIFFMITASFSLQKSIQVPPPNPDEDGVSQSLQTLDDFREESIIVEIDSNNGIYVDDTKLSNPTEIVQAILDRRDEGGRPKTELVLSAHKAARHETVVAVVDAANEVGMQKIRLASYKGPDD
ncbi:biopolymer transport protein ExbD [Gimesia chilikensis]|uniref:Biopolymer transport protein ExbD n=1 Tax=Gimesia chilikensis TaxID=2605989 RepID=A0A517WEH6_9PLAN|nr:biopolymer transporter ExbD [Gimesia chilikensis]QDU03653.1 biopolymer transport protein ExbD [Gimesia chilikensis]